MNRFVIERLLAQASTEEPESKTKKYIKKMSLEIQHTTVMS